MHLCIGIVGCLIAVLINLRERKVRAPKSNTLLNGKDPILGDRKCRRK